MMINLEGTTHKERWWIMQQLRRHHIEHETAFVGAGVGGRFAHTSELHVKHFNTVMKQPDSNIWGRLHQC